MSATCEMRMSHALSGLAPDAYRTPRALPWALGLLPPRGAPCLESGLLLRDTIRTQLRQRRHRLGIDKRARLASTLLLLISLPAVPALLVGCSGDDDTAQSQIVQLAVVADFTATAERLGDDFTARTGIVVVATSGASGELASQISAGGGVRCLPLRGHPIPAGVSRRRVRGTRTCRRRDRNAWAL